MTASVLPEDGELQLGPVRLPSGRRVTPYDHDEPVAWVTRRPVPDPGLVWTALTDLHGQTGLVPVVLNDEDDDYDDLFMAPSDVAELDRLDAADLLALRWQGELDDDDDDDPRPRLDTPRSNEFLGLRSSRMDSMGDFAKFVFGIVKMAENPEARAEFERLNKLDREEAGPEHDEWAARSREREARRAEIGFPGLAPATDGSLSSSARMAALRSLRPARIGLVVAGRPADVLPTVGWTCFDDPAYEDDIRNAVWIGAVLRSWENRFAARLLALGPGAVVKLLVQRPPRTLEAAQKIAVEHSAFCSECAGQGLTSVREIAPVLIDAPIWTFWWD
jgi:Domain of unknown function (DUF4253)